MIWYFPGISGSDNSKGQTGIIPISIGHTSIRAYVATTTEAQERGLGGRESIGSDESMLFVFGTADAYSFWMKDMKFPIDIFWVDEFKHIVFIKENALPESFPESFTPNSPAKYVLETQSGFAKKNDVKIGDSVLF
jgi:uncharacterized membrane protein (UPF0127 family)